MEKLVELNRLQVVKIMENNLKKLKSCYHSDTFIVMSYDLEIEKPAGNRRVDRKGGIRLMNQSKTFVLNKDVGSEFEVSLLSMYTQKQEDIYNILPFGKKYDVLLIPDFKLG